MTRKKIAKRKCAFQHEDLVFYVFVCACARISGCACALARMRLTDRINKMHLMAQSQRAHNVKMMYRRHYDVIRSHQRQYDVMCLLGLSIIQYEDERVILLITAAELQWLEH